MKKLERVQNRVIIPEDKKLKPGMKKETVKMIIIKWRNMPRYFLFPTTYKTKEYNTKKNYLGI